MEWNDQFMKIFFEGVTRYHEAPQTAPSKFFLPQEVEFLESIGYRAEEMYAYVLDYATLGEPSPGTALLIASVRRSYFITAQRGIRGATKTDNSADLPAEDESVQEIPYLPRLIHKAIGKLSGWLAPSVMYYSAKDREFLREHGNIHPADFLHLAWMVRCDKQRIVEAVLNTMRNSNAASAETEAKESEPDAKAAAKPAPSGTPVQTTLDLD